MQDKTMQDKTMQDYAGQCRTMQDNAGQCRTMQDNAGQCRTGQDKSVTLDKVDQCKKLESLRTDIKGREITLTIIIISVNNYFR